MRKLTSFCAFIILFSGCAATGDLLGTSKLETPPEFNQKVQLRVSDEYHMHQAPSSKYDLGDLENFHVQHTLPVVIEGAFKELFGEVEIVHDGPQLEVEPADVPAVFEVRIIDVANDNTFKNAEEYRGELTLAVAMKSPKEHTVFWQKAFLGKGYVRVNNEYETNMGAQDALEDALRDAVDQMQKALIASPEVRHQLKYYKSIEEERKKQQEAGI